ncbi:hypothetical protein BGZ70_005503, partial [Mortierella alpina]
MLKAIRATVSRQAQAAQPGINFYVREGAVMRNSSPRSGSRRSHQQNLRGTLLDRGEETNNEPNAG